MLVLTRREGERIRLLTSDGEVWIQVLAMRRSGVGIGITAPRTVVIEREEIINRNRPEEKETDRVPGNEPV